MGGEPVVAGRLRRADDLQEIVVLHLGAPQEVEGGAVSTERSTQYAMAPVRRYVRGAHPSADQPVNLEIGQSLFLLEQAPALVVHQSELATRRCQTQVGVVFSQDEAVFGPTGKHAIGLAGAARDEIVNQHAEIGLAPLRHPRLASAKREGRVDPSHQPLGGRLLVTRRPVYLAREEQSSDAAGLE